MEQRGLAGTVASDEADPAIDGNIRRFEQNSPAKL
jgi:hypothetical protein